jgi:hypothetical protein
VIRTFAAAASGTGKPGSIAMVPPTLAGNGPGGHDHREGGHRGHGQQGLAALAPAQQGPAEPGRAQDPVCAVDHHRVVAQAVEPPGLEHVQAERGFQRQV